MTYIPNGPMEIALVEAGVQTQKATPKITSKTILVVFAALLAGGTIVYVVMNGKNKKSTAPTESKDA